MTEVNGEHHVYIHNHTPLKVGAQRKILKQVSTHFGISLVQLIKQLDL
jgi:hypothetical protein